MSFELPNLDTATFAGIQTQLVRRIPQFTKQWTDYNASDPGITLIQLLSWLGESLMYQANAIPLETQRNFLRWVLGLPLSSTQWPYAVAAQRQSDFAFLDLQAVLAGIERGATLSAEDMQRAVLTFLGAPYLPLSLGEAEQLAQQTNRLIDQPQAAKPSPQPPARVARAYAAVVDEATVVHILDDTQWVYARPGLANNTTAPGADGLYHALSILQPAATPDAATRLAALLTTVSTFLAPRVLAGATLRVVAARLTDINLAIRIRCPANVQPGVVLEALLSQLAAYFNPLAGWTYGQAPDLQQVRQVIAAVPGVAAIESLALDYAPTLRLPGARLGVTALLADLPPGEPALIYAGLPRLRCLDLSAGTVAP